MIAFPILRRREAGLQRSVHCWVRRSETAPHFAPEGSRVRRQIMRYFDQDRVQYLLPIGFEKEAEQGFEDPAMDRPICTLLALTLGRLFGDASYCR
jgi:hypothetical protein